MTALNIIFSDEEMAQLRQRAKAEGTSLRNLVHDAAVQTEDDAAVWAAYQRTKVISAELLRRLADQ